MTQDEVYRERDYNASNYKGYVSSPMTEELGNAILNVVSENNRLLREIVEYVRNNADEKTRFRALNNVLEAVVDGRFQLNPNKSTFMNWKSINHFSEDDYGKPILLRVNDKGYDEPRYVSCFITICKSVCAIGQFRDERIVLMSDLKLSDDMCYIRIDEIL